MGTDDQEISYKKFFSPLTNVKAIFWLIAIGFVVFFNSFFNGFAGDDFGQIVTNTAVHDIRNIPHFFSVSTFESGNGITGIYYKPLLLTAFSLVYAIGGLNPFFFHFFQVCIFITNAVLVFLFIQKFLSKKSAFFLALAFLLHPINQEAAGYISCYQEVLFFFFGMSALLLSDMQKSKYTHLLMYFFFVLSLFSKETGILFVGMHIVYITFFKPQRLKETIVYSLLVTIPYLFLHFWVVGFGFAQTQIFHISRLPFHERIISSPKIVLYYLQTFLFPKDLAISYDWIVSSMNVSDFYVPLVLVLLFLTCTFWLGKYIFLSQRSVFRIYLFFCLWFFMGLSMHIQVIPLGGTVGPRWFYFPIVGLLGMIGVSLHIFLKQAKTKIGAQILFGFLILLSSIQVIMRNTDFKDNTTLTCHDAAVSYPNFALESSCGSSLNLDGAYDQAQVHLERSIAFAPYYGTNSYLLGSVFGAKAENQKSKKFYKKAKKLLLTAIEITPTSPYAYDVLGYLYTYHEDRKTAKDFLQMSVKKFPKDGKLWFYLAITAYTMDEKELSKEAITRAYMLNSSDVLTAKFYNALINNGAISLGNKFYSLD